MERVDRITVKAARPTDAPSVDSVVELLPTADHQEREVYDMFGVVFAGTRPAADPDARGLRGLPAAPRLPDRRRTGALHLQRGRWLVRRNERADVATARLRLPQARASRSRSRGRAEPVARRERTQELLTLNFGPHHPATHGVLRLLVTLEGEVVRDIKPIIGYVHTGIEKTAEDKSYWKVIPVVERMDYLSYYFNAMAFCGAVETLLEVEVPPRAQYLRVIHLELNRIASHLFWLGTSALDLGAISIFWYCLRERETILDLFEMSSGQRMHTRYFQVGGVVEDIPRGLRARSCASSSRMMPERADQYGAILERNEIVLQRLRGTVPARRRDAARARRHRPAAARRRQPVGPAQGRRRTELRPLRLQDPGRHGWRQLRPLPRFAWPRSTSR